ncbi:MAG: DUF4476 domain-containing protein [Hymenobacter sp.]
MLTQRPRLRPATAPGEHSPPSLATATKARAAPTASLKRLAPAMPATRPTPASRPAPLPPAPGYPAPEARATWCLCASADVVNLAQALRRCNFDDKRLPLLYQALAQSSLRAGDLALLVRTMTFNDSQKETAKFGYARLVDPQNFYRVLEALTFATSANETLADLGLARR